MPRHISGNFKQTTVKIFNFILGLLICFSFSSCIKHEPKPEEVYNQKANEIIFQTMSHSPCHCMLEIQKKSMIEMMYEEAPRYHLRRDLIKEFNLKSNASLDSLVNISKNFHLDVEKFRMNKIKIIPLKDFLTLKNGGNKELSKMCPEGIVVIKKPIFDKTFQTAAFDYDMPFCCTKTLPLPLYKYINGTWKPIED